MIDLIRLPKSGILMCPILLSQTRVSFTGLASCLFNDL